MVGTAPKVANVCLDLTERADSQKGTRSTLCALSLTSGPRTAAALASALKLLEVCLWDGRLTLSLVSHLNSFKLSLTLRLYS